jgi:urease accessory protein
MESESFFRLLQLVSPGLPVGAYSYSEGLETLVQAGKIRNLQTLQSWLTYELEYGAIRVEAAILVRSHRCAHAEDWQGLNAWNHWLSAFRETEELRERSWQMGRSLSRLLQDLTPETKKIFDVCDNPCNFATAFSIAAACWQIDCESAALGYLQSWAANLVNAGVRLIPLGQTQGQQLLLNLYPIMQIVLEQVLTLVDEQFDCCNWGLTISSMNHEVLYTRLFRS